MDNNRRIAVVGSGVSGAVCAWLLRDIAPVSLFESQARYGGHTHTFVDDRGPEAVAVDTGFMVFNRPNYPLLSALFDRLAVVSYPTDMSFAASFDDGRLEYAGTDVNSLFGQRRNLVNPRFWGVLLDILRFNRAARDALERELGDRLSLGEFLDHGGFGDRFRALYLYPMAAAIWSCPRGRIAQFPAISFLRFFANHGLIRIADRPQWQTVEGSSSSYMNRLIADLGDRAHADARVVRLTRRPDAATLTFADGSRAVFDEVVLACHSDQALKLLDAPTPEEADLLGAIPYQANRVVLHMGATLMPRERRVWSSWNYLSAFPGRVTAAGAPVSVTYWMNSLQRLPTRRDYFVTLNPLREPRDGSLVAEFVYHHPVFGAAALRAQRRLHRLQGRCCTWFAGAWTGYGFHEDGIRSAAETAQALGARVPWGPGVQASRDLAMVPKMVRHGITEAA